MVWTKQATLQGPPGPPGATGPAGPQGDPGTPGPTDEQIQDLMATTMNDSAHINWTYNDALNYLSCDLFAASVNTADLTNDGVTYAKIQPVTDNRLLGRSAGSAGDVQELTVGGGLTLAGGVLNGPTLGTAATQPYTDTTFTITGTGFTTAVTGTARYVLTGKQVTLHLPVLTGTSNATSFTLTGIPAALTPGSPSGFLYVPRISDGVTETGGFLTVSGTTFTVNRPGFAAWPTSGTKTLYNTWITYLVV